MKEQSALRNYLNWLLFFSCAWWIVLIPLDYNLFDFFLLPVQIAAKWGTKVFYSGNNYASDASGMYALMLFALFLALISAFFVQLFKKKISLSPQHLGHNLITFFVSLVLIKYGWIKVIKLQFYLPEPNIIYRPFGMLSKDIAYWSLIGTSRVYSIATGILEVVAGCLLIFRRTRLIGFLLSTGIFANVLLINISFDISVKLFSLTLLLFSVLGMLYYKEKLKVLIGFPLKINKETNRNSLVPPLFKSLLVTVIVLEALYPSIVTQSLNDDERPRPEHHGAYSILDSEKYSRLFIHHDLYLILENRSGDQQDFKLDPAGHNAYSILDQRTGKAGTLVFQRDNVILSFGNPDTLKIKKLPYRSLPLMTEKPHIFSDSYH